MTWGFRKSFGLGRLLRVNLSKSGTSLTGKVGRLSTNSRTRRLRVGLPFGAWWQSKRMR
jgi:hypothetical protein